MWALGGQDGDRTFGVKQVPQLGSFTTAIGVFCISLVFTWFDPNSTDQISSTFKIIEAETRTCLLTDKNSVIPRSCMSPTLPSFISENYSKTVY